MKLAGDLAEFSLPDLLQIQGAAGRTTALKLLGPEGSGVVYLRSGQVIHAQYANLSGEDAFYAMVGLKIGYFEETEVPANVPRTVGQTVADLLFRAHELEARQALPTPRRVARPAPGPPLPPTAAAASVDPARPREPAPAPAAVPAVAASSSTTTAGAPHKSGAVPRRGQPLLLWLMAGVATVGIGLAAVGLRGDSKPEPSAAAAPAASARILEARALTGPNDRQPTLISGLAPSVPAGDLAVLPTIVCRIRIDESGRVAEAKVYRSRVELEAFEEAAVRAIEAWRFSPGAQEGRPVSVWINWPVEFR